MAVLFYPTNIQESAASKIMFIPRESGAQYGAMFDTKEFDWAAKIMPPKGAIMLPIPNGAISEELSHDWTEEEGLLKKAITAVAGEKINAALDTASVSAGYVKDPSLHQQYKSTKARSWSGSFVFIPNNMAESGAVSEIIRHFKMWSSPRKEKLGVVKYPLIFEISFLNPQLQMSMQLKKMVLNTVSVEYFSNGVPVSYHDGSPKQITMNLSFTEYGIKYAEDWEITGG